MKCYKNVYKNKKKFYNILLNNIIIVVLSNKIRYLLVKKHILIKTREKFQNFFRINNISLSTITFFNIEIQNLQLHAFTHYV